MITPASRPTTAPRRSVGTRRRAVAALSAGPGQVALGCGLLSLVVFSVGIGRAYGHDAAHSVGLFITTPSFAAALWRQQAFNNHVLFSVLDHAVYVLGGSRREWALRLLPVTLGAAAVALLAGEVARRTTRLGGVVAGIALCGNSLVLREFRDVRGYSLATLGVLIASILLWRAVSPGRSTAGFGTPRGLATGYVVALAAALATHLGTALVLPMHALVVRRHQLPWRRWSRYLGTSIFLALPFQLTGLLQAIRRPPARQFDLRFPVYFLSKMLGGPASALAVGIAVVVGVVAVGDKRLLATCALWLGAAAGGLWVLGPFGLGPRYFVWVAPGVAALVGLSAHAHRRLAPFIVAAVALQVAFSLQRFAHDDIADRAAAQAIASSPAGGTVCAIGDTAWSLVGYTSHFVAVNDVGATAACSLVVSTNESRRDRVLAASACAFLPYRERLSATTPGVACSAHPFGS